MKKIYERPSVNVVEMHLDNQLLGTSNTVKNTSGNAIVNYNGGGRGPARSRQRSAWDGWE